MQIAFMATLVIALVAAMISFVVMGTRHLGRSRTLARHSHERGMRFSREDPFGVPERYRDFALISCGHSPRACNVSHGQIDSWNVRAFDFRYEVGHGTRRMTCHYSVIVIDTQIDFPNVLMWSDADAEHAPLEVRRSDGHVDCWCFTGSGALADVLRNAAGSLVAEGLSMQVRGSMLMVALPAFHRRGWDYTVWMDTAMKLPCILRDSREQPGMEAAGTGGAPETEGIIRDRLENGYGAC